MTDRVLDFADSPAYLHVRNQQLVIDRKPHDPVTLPLAEVAVLILAHPQLTCTQSVFSVLLEHGGTVVACDRSHLPIGLMLPTAAHFAQTERFAAQASAGAPRKKRAWQQIVKAKLRAQAAALESLRGHDAGLREFAKRVRSGDPDNVEAQGARRYWPALFEDSTFRRRREAPDANRFLNYGYAVLRAIVARAVCAAGLHPSLGLQHHNRYNAYCLADDLMEPYRPLVDTAVVQLVERVGPDAPLERDTKHTLLEVFTARYRADDEVRTLFDVVTRTTSSLAQVYLQQSQQVWFPRDLSHAGG